MTESGPCIAAEAMSSFVDGTLDGEAVAEVVRHLSRCAKCRLITERAAEIEDDRLGTTQTEDAHRAWRYAAIAAVILVAAGAASLLFYQARRREHPDPISLMAASTPTTARTLEPRLSGGFRWAPYQNVMASAEKKSPQQLTAAGAAAQVVRELKHDQSPEALHAKGVAYLLQDDAATAIPLLRLSAHRRPDNARVWNDLAAALYVEAHTEATWRDALAAARRAAALDPHLTEAFFNVALILERIGTRQEIKAAWNEYLRRDPSGGWAEEARERLAHDHE